jgi:hypothetical protein
MVISYTDPLTEGGVSYTYSKANGTFSPLEVISDTSEGFTVSNAHTTVRKNLLATAASAEATSVEAIINDGYVECTINVTPTATTDKFRIGLYDFNNFVINNTYELEAGWDGANPAYQIYENGVLQLSVLDLPFTSATMQVLRYGGIIYYKVNGITLPYSSILPQSTGIANASFSGIDDAVAIDDITLVNWENRQADPISVTFAGVSDFTESSNAPASENFPAHYYIYFVPPADFASLSAELSPTLEVGYNIGIVSNFTVLPDENITLLAQTLLTTDSIVNQFFDLGTRTNFQQVNMTVNTLDSGGTSIPDPQTFLMIINTGNGTTQTFPVLSLYYQDFNPLCNILSTFTQFSTEIDSFILIQVDGETELNVGTPAALYLAP